MTLARLFALICAALLFTVAVTPEIAHADDPPAESGKKAKKAKKAKAAPEAPAETPAATDEAKAEGESCCKDGKCTMEGTDCSCEACANKAAEATDEEAPADDAAAE